MFRKALKIVFLWHFDQPSVHKYFFAPKHFIFSSKISYYLKRSNFRLHNRTFIFLFNLSHFCIVTLQFLFCKTHLKMEIKVSKFWHNGNMYSSQGYYLETDPDPIATPHRVELFTHKPSDTNTYWHCMVTHAQLSVYRACEWKAQL